jgi:N-acetylmuramoyl-L-alanine amidase
MTVAAAIYSCRAVVAAGKETSVAVLSHRLILDAGHGGFDGGTTGTNGVLEKDLNLAITQKTASIARLMGFSVVMVRESDTSVQDDGLTTLREKKVSDIHNRLALAEQYTDAIFLSIHQNFFPQASCKGTQIFYSTNNPTSELLASCLQKGITERLQPDNTRAIKPAEKNLYILYHAKNPALLIECGFLSNEEECEKLCKDDYQQEMAFSIICSLLEGLRQES